MSYEPIQSPCESLLAGIAAAGAPRTYLPTDVIFVKDVGGACAAITVPEDIVDLTIKGDGSTLTPYGVNIDNVTITASPLGVLSAVGATITSPDGTITVGGTAAAPTLQLNWADADNCEGVQDCVGTVLAATGLVAYNDGGNSFTLPAGALAGQVPTVNAGGTAVVYSTPTSGLQQVFGLTACVDTSLNAAEAITQFHFGKGLTATRTAAGNYKVETTPSIVLSAQVVAVTAATNLAPNTRGASVSATITKTNTSCVNVLHKLEAAFSLNGTDSAGGAQFRAAMLDARGNLNGSQFGASPIANICTSGLCSVVPDAALGGVAQPSVQNGSTNINSFVVAPAGTTTYQVAIGTAAPAGNIGTFNNVFGIVILNLIEIGVQ